MPETDFEEKMILIRRTARMQAGGRRFRFGALVVVGDRQGRVGPGPFFFEHQTRTHGPGLGLAAPQTRAPGPGLGFAKSHTREPGPGRVSSTQPPNPATRATPGFPGPVYASP